MIHDIFYLRSILQESINLIRESYYDSKAKKTEIFKELKSNGVVIVRDFYSVGQCEELINELEKILSKANEYNIIKDNLESDKRVFAADLVSSKIAEFLNNEFINKELLNYSGRSISSKFTMANKVDFIPGNLGSGGGWHRDSPHQRQVKSILYLSNVQEINGAFEYLIGTHKPSDALVKRIFSNLAFNQSRFNDKVVDEIIKVNPSKHVVLTGKPGTLVLVDTRGIHRGSPIKSGVRYALTNYFFEKSFPSHIKKNFVVKMKQFHG